MLLGDETDKLAPLPIALGSSIQYSFTRPVHPYCSP